MSEPCDFIQHSETVVADVETTILAADPDRCYLKIQNLGSHIVYYTFGDAGNTTGVVANGLIIPPLYDAEGNIGYIPEVVYRDVPALTQMDITFSCIVSNCDIRILEGYRR